MLRHTRIYILFIAFITLFSSASFATTPFVVQHIKIQGLQRIGSSAVMQAMPLHVGQTFTDAEGNAIIAALFKTGFFSNVDLTRDGNTLIVNVVELPTINSITITGNKAIKAKVLKPVLKKLHIVVGDTFDPSQLHAIVLGLQEQYAMLGHAGAQVVPTVTHLPRNRVSIHIRVKEGKATIVHSIQISGNHAFTQHELLENFKLTTPSIFTWFNHNDRYSDMRLDTDLEALQNFYFNHGYLDFRVISHDVQTLPKGGVVLHIALFEGPVYHLSGYQLSASHLRSQFIPKIQHLLTQLKTGDAFSKQQVMQINEDIGNYLADNGYALPLINPVPILDRTKHLVFLTYYIQGGQRVYVRDIHILGNTFTSGTVIRTQLRQMESAPYSLKEVKESKRRIANLPYLDHIEVNTVPVPNKPDQVDLDYHVHEVSAGRASVQAGYSDMEGFLYGANVSEPNFLGSGRYVSLGFQRSAYTQNYGFTYNNPFYTISGISRAFSVSYTHMTPGHVNLEPYTMDDFGTSMTYGIPLSELDVLSAGLGYDYITIANVNPLLVSPSITRFMQTNPSPYNQIKVMTGLSHANYDRAIFPTKGNQQTLSLSVGAPIVSSSLSYYQTVYDSRFYYPMGYGFIFDPHITLGFGDSYGNTKQFPFFNNFYAGGIQTLPGYMANTLGPKNPNNITQGLGGNMQLLGGLNFILPDFISNKVRTAAIIGAGNIFQTNHVPGIQYEAIALKNLRATAGIMVSWWSPLGAPLDFSLAWPLNQKPGDQLQWFGFSFGAAI